MSTKITVPLMLVKIRRDANTINKVTVPNHELPILRTMFGKENVVVGDQVSTYDLEPAGEIERLSAKYGSQKVAKVYGEDDRLSEMVERSSLGPAPSIDDDDEDAAPKAVKSTPAKGGRPKKVNKAAPAAVAETA